MQAIPSNKQRHNMLQHNFSSFFEDKFTREMPMLTFTTNCSVRVSQHVSNKTTYWGQVPQMHISWELTAFFYQPQPSLPTSLHSDIWAEWGKTLYTIWCIFMFNNQSVTSFVNMEFNISMLPFLWTHSQKMKGFVVACCVVLKAQFSLAPKLIRSKD